MDRIEPHPARRLTTSPQSLATSSTSLAASILDYRIENGRTYHAYKDGSESARSELLVDNIESN